MSDTNARIEGFLLDAFSDHGNNSSVVSENTRRRLAELEHMFRRQEVDERKKDAAAERCRMLCRLRVVEAIDKLRGTPMETHLQLVLRAIERPARTRLPPWP
jgi:hypothetical protein